MINVGVLEAILRLRDEMGPKLKTAQDDLLKFGRSTRSAGLAVLPLSIAVAGVGAAVVKMGSDVVEGENLVKESFQGMTDAANQWSSNLQESLGLNKFELREQAASFNLLALNMGQSEEQAFKTATSMTELATDLESFLNIPMAEATRALQSGLVGNTEALRSLNIFVNEATLRQVALANGIIDTDRQLTQQEKFLATYAAILDQTSQAQGDLARTMESPANAFRRFQESIKIAGAELGIALMPLIQASIPLLGTLSDLVLRAVEMFSGLPTPVQGVIVGFGALVAVAGPLLILVGQMAIGLAALPAAFGGVTAVVGGLGTAMSSVLLPALAAVATAIAAYKITDWILEWTGLRETLDDVAESLLGVQKIRDQIGQSDQDVAMIQRANELLGVQFSSLQQATAAMTTYNQVLRDTGSESDAVAAATANLSDELAGHSLTTAAYAASDALSQMMSVMGSLGNILGLFGIDLDSVIGRMTRGVSAVQSFGRAIGGVVGSFLGGPAGTLIGAGVGLISSLFTGGRDADTVKEEVARDMGAIISDGLAEAIHRAGQNPQLSLAAIFREGGMGIDRFAEEFGDIFSGLEMGWFSQSEAVQALQENVGTLIDNFDELGPSGREQVNRIIEAAKSMGIEFEGLAELQDLFEKSIIDTKDEAIAAFEAMGGSVDRWRDHLVNGAKDAELAVSRLIKIMRKVQLGQDLNPTQERFLGRVGLPPDVSAQGGYHHPGIPRDMTIRAHRGEAVHIDKPGRMGNINISVNFQGPISDRETFREIAIDAVKEGMRSVHNERGLRSAFQQEFGI